MNKRVGHEVEMRSLDEFCKKQASGEETKSCQLQKQTAKLKPMMVALKIAFRVLIAYSERKKEKDKVPETSSSSMQTSHQKEQWTGPTNSFFYHKPLDLVRKEKVRNEIAYIFFPKIFGGYYHLRQGYVLNLMMKNITNITSIQALDSEMK